MRELLFDFNDSTVLKRMKNIRQDAHMYYQQIWLDAMEFYEEYHFEPMTKEAADFLAASFGVIKEIGVSVENYSFADLRVINSLLAAASCWGRDDLIANANISDEFIAAIEDALERQGVQFM